MSKYIENERFIEVYKLLINDRKISNKSDLAQKIGTIPQNIYDIFSHRVKISSKILDELECKFEINKGYILLGEGQMFSSDNATIEINDKGIGVPIFDIDATCGLEVRDFRDEKIIGYIDLPSINKDTVIIFASGDSMYPLIEDKAMIVIREIKSWDIIAYGHIYLIVTSEYRLLKYVRKHQNKDYIILRSENKDYDDIELPKKDIVRLFLVENVLSVKNLM